MMTNSGLILGKCRASSFSLTFSFILLLFSTSTGMVSLKLQKRLASSIIGVGKRKIWLDPNESSEIGMANSSMSRLINYL